MKIKMTFTEEMLGTASANPEIHAEFIASNAPDAKSKEEEIAALGTEAVVEKAMTIFPKDDKGRPILWDYQVKGYFKENFRAMLELGLIEPFKKPTFSFWSCCHVLDKALFINPRKILLNIPHGLKMGFCQRPLKAETMKGPRVALANSETVPAGTWIEFDIKCYVGRVLDEIKKVLDYGAEAGFGAWRNSGKGRFSYEIIKA